MTSQSSAAPKYTQIVPMVSATDVKPTFSAPVTGRDPLRDHLYAINSSNAFKAYSLTQVLLNKYPDKL